MGLKEAIAAFVGIALLNSLVAQGVRVTFCSEANLGGTCATKNVERGIFSNKCEDFPFRFRWFWTARSVKVVTNLLGGCPATCRLYSSKRLDSVKIK